MALSDNPFVGLASADLTKLKAAYLQCLLDIVGGGQSYTINGREFTRANLPEVRKTLFDINQAIALQDGTGKQFAQARANGCGGRAFDADPWNS